MAGGRGERLRPLTDHEPKPMLRIGRKPMLECVMDRFIDQGFREFHISVHYRADLIEGYFGSGEKWGVSINYLREHDPLGTAGALGLLPPQSDPFIVANADVMADIDYQALLAAHDTSGCLATMCLSLYQHQVPYGVVLTDGGLISGIREKPIESWAVNAGVYAISPGALGHLGTGRVDMPDFLSRFPVNTYQLDGYWSDVGRFEDYTRAAGAMI